MRRFAEFAVLVILGAACLWSAYRTVHPSSVPLAPQPAPVSARVPALVKILNDQDQLWCLPVDANATFQAQLDRFEKEHPRFACGGGAQLAHDPECYYILCREAIPAQDVTIQ